MAQETHAQEVLSAEEAADFLGVWLRTIYRWVAERGLPHAKIGGLLRFRRAALLEWVAEQERKTMEGKGGE